MTALNIHRSDKPTLRHAPLQPMSKEDRTFWQLLRSRREAASPIAGAPE